MKSKLPFTNLIRPLQVLFSAFLLGFFLQSCAPRFHKTPWVAFDDEDLSRFPISKTLIVRDGPPRLPIRLECTEEDIKAAELCILLNLGEDYNYGTNPFTTSIDVSITAYSSFDATTGIITGPWEGAHTIEITPGIPEKLACFDFTGEHARINSFKVEITGYLPNTLVRDDINFEAYFTENLAVDAKYVYAPHVPIVSVNRIRRTTNPQTFTWRSACPNIPNYQFQLLRLYNKDETTSLTETEITAEVDWSKALTIETGSSETALTLTIAEGTGFYLWRVRPIGNYYEGGMANDANWGVWSNVDVWDTLPDRDNLIELSTSRFLPAYAFFYTQFDDNQNWIYSRTFTEDNKIAEQITYANGLLQIKQNQRRLQSQDTVLVSQTVYDFSGRPALTSMSAPVASNALGYVNRFLQQDGELYAANHFDADVNYKDPSAITAGPLHDYYSDSNPDISIPDAEGYPFIRTLYYAEGTSRIKELSGVGSVHRIKSDPHESRTVKVFYSGILEAELIPVFGDETPADTSVYKIITLDPNKTATVVYVNSVGDTIATCLAVSPDNEALLDPLPSREGSIRQITGAITGNSGCGDGCLESSTTLTFTQPTPLTLEYQITPEQVQELCLNTCQTCDYKVYFSIQRLDEYDPDFPLIDSLIVSPGECDTTDFNWSNTYPLTPGKYRVGRRIIGNNRPEPLANTYLQERINLLRSDLQDQIRNSETLTQVFAYLETDDPDLDGLYDYLGVPEDATTTTITAGCCDIEIPVQRCETLTCPDPENPDFIGHFESFWVGESFIGRPRDRKLLYLPDYTWDEFNQLIYNMIHDPDTPYDCNELWRCWDALTSTYKDALAGLASDIDFDYDPDADFSSYNLIEQFFWCAGRRLRGLSTREFGDFDDPGYLSHAYAYVKCQRRDFEDCGEVLTGTRGVEPDCESPDYTYLADREDLEDPLRNSYEKFYRCISAERPARSSARYRRLRDEIITEENIEETCEEVCEARFSANVQSLGWHYEELGYVRDDARGYVRGDDVIPWREIYCHAQALVDQCKEGCDLTPVTDHDGNLIRLGTEDEIQRMIESMAYILQLHPAEDGICPDGFTRMEREVDFADLLVAWLNLELGRFLSGLSGDGGYFNMGRLVRRLNSPCQFPKNCFPDSLRLGGVVEGEFFVDDSCRLALRTKVREINPPAEYWQERVICDNICDCQLGCGPLCYRWLLPEIEPTHFLIPRSCEQATADYLKSMIQEQVAQCIENNLNSLEATYRTQCLTEANIRDRFTATYDLGYYHYTLFYYDRAGNLVRTVPPKGADLSSVSRNDPPAHTYVTEYEYNSLGQLFKQETPDAGIITYFYDRLGQLRFSQNDKQRRERAYSYSKYDYLGRVTETGKSGENIADFEDFVDEQDFPRTLNSEVITTVYSQPSTTIGRTQLNLQNRVSHTFTDENAATYFSYDAHGNVEWLAQSIPDLGIKFVDYEYDMISGNVRMMKYNSGEPDQFFHRFGYDADNRLIQVETSRDSVIWDRDARYEYYAHGPLRRLALGEDKVQGVDYTYTIHGWLKGINHPDTTRDPGQDGFTTSPNNTVGKDAFGMALGYYTGDFKRTGSSFLSSEPTNLSPERGLFNGYITSWSHQIAANPAGESLQYEGLAGSTYRYDEIGRLKVGAFQYYDTAWQTTEDYATQYDYDANGNILKLLRNGYAARFLQMDSLIYHYEDGSNRLNHVTDTVSVDNYATDLDNQESNNYRYDEIGNMIRDIKEGIESIDWNVYGKVKQIEKIGDVELEFKYNAAGHRVAKIINETGTLLRSTYYVRDASGQILSIYSHEGPTLAQKEVPIYGSERLGVFRPETSAYSSSTSGFFERRLGHKNYELKDHLSNVRATTSDIKLSHVLMDRPEDFSAEILSYDNYYPFGSMMPDRGFESDNHRFGFNGMEKDDEVKGSGNSYTTEFRFYDSRLGRWLGLDPLMHSSPDVSAYTGLDNNPVLFIDTNGDIIDFSNVDERYRQKIVDDLRIQTGLRTLDIDQNGHLVYDSSREYDPSMQGLPDPGSATARELIISAINSSETVTSTVEPHVELPRRGEGGGMVEGSQVDPLNPNTIYLDIGETEGFIQGLQGHEGINPTTIGWGMVFMHELKHTSVGGRLHDNTGAFDPQGDVVRFMNRIRRQLAPEYGQRIRYGGPPIREQFTGPDAPPPEPSGGCGCNVPGLR